MTPTLIVNDLHLGVRRSAGTTNASAAALGEFAHSKHSALLQLAVDQGCTRVIVNGDLTDVFDIELSDAIEIYSAAATFLHASTSHTLIWALGNHDLSKDSSKLGTVAFIGGVLKVQFEGRFSLVSETTYLPADDICIIPHLPNQALFDHALSKVPSTAKYVLAHCNFDNKFAGQQDHSLNIERSKVKELIAAGATVVLGHEHQHRSMFNDKLIIVGNQFPTSIADCLSHGNAQKDGCKYALKIDDSGDELINTWSVDDYGHGFREIDWTDLADAPITGLGFVRVAGKAEAAQAADVIRAISMYRTRSNAFVITNAVEIAGNASMEDLVETAQDIRAVDVISLLMEHLDEKQQAAVKQLLEQQEQ